MHRGVALKPIPPHGTVRRYRSRVAKCKCANCRMAWAAYIQNYRTEKGKKVEQWGKVIPLIRKAPPSTECSTSSGGT